MGSDSQRNGINQHLDQCAICRFAAVAYRRQISAAVQTGRMAPSCYERLSAKMCARGAGMLDAILDGGGRAERNRGVKP